MGNEKHEDLLSAVLLLRRHFLPSESNLDNSIDAAFREGSLDVALMAFLSTKAFRKRFAGLFTGIEFDYASPHIDTEAPTGSLHALFEQVAREWEELGSSQPVWSVLSREPYKNVQRDTVPQSFYISGEREAKRLVGALRRNGIAPPFTRAVEYGCGLGRVSIPLSRFCRHLDAYDISGSHIELAKRHAAETKVENILFHQVETPSDRPETGYDLYYSCLVFQHNPPPVILRLIRNALEGLAPDGVAVFQLPVFLKGYEFKLNSYLGRRRSGIEMHAVPQRLVLDIISEKGCRLLDLYETSTNLRDRILSNIFTVQKIAGGR